MKSLILSAAAAATLFGSSVNAETLDGTWTSVAPENLGQMFATRTFEFSGDSWSIDFSAYGDAEATVHLFTVDVEGTYIVGGDSAVEGAKNAVFFITDRSLTASEIGVGIFEGMGCTLDAGVEKDLLNDACGFLPSVMDSAMEYDLFAVKGDQLFLGERSGDLSKERPAALIPFALTKTN